MSRTRLLLLVLVGLALSGCSRQEDWIPLFDGKSLDGWKVAEHPGSVTVEDGQMVCRGPRAHAFYVGDVHGGTFRNFELRAEVLTRPGANSGIYFHTAYQESGWPEQGYEVQINNTHTGEGGYVERKKTASLYGVRNVYKQLVPDEEWFTLEVRVEGRKVTTRLNGETTVEYIEPEGQSGMRKLGEGTFAVQCHDPNSTVSFRRIEVRALPDEAGRDLPPAPAPDSIDMMIARLQRDNFPVIDYHVHLKGGITLDEALAQSRRTGINFGIAPNCGLGFPIENDEGIYAFLDSMKGKPVFLGMQAEGREWTTLFSPEAVSRFDYVFTDAMTFTDDAGKRMRLWIPEEVGVIEDPQRFMDMYVDRILGVLNNEPIDIYVNPTYLPEQIAPDYDRLWSEPRMKAVIDAAVHNDVAIEINTRYRIPGLPFLRLAKEAGAKFSCGTNNKAEVLSRSEYCLEVIDALGLTGEDMFSPRRESKRAAPSLAGVR